MSVPVIIPLQLAAIAILTYIVVCKLDEIIDLLKNKKDE